MDKRLQEKEWINNTTKWSLLYRTDGTKRPTAINPTSVRLKFCFRCGLSKRDMARHHTGSDYFFARLLPNVYARDYIAFRADQVEWLCKKCHELAHRRYRETIREFWAVVNYRYAGNPNKDVCDEYMNRLRKIFYTWCKRYRKPKPKKRVKIK